MTSMQPQFPGQPKWPNVPACFEWLSLDRRGDWRLQGERVTHHGLVEFMNRQYGSDEAGRWFVQNGPQRVYVDLACTPWVFRRDGEGFVSHTGTSAGEVRAVLLDDEGSFLIEAELGIGLLDDRDLAACLAECSPDDETSLLAFLRDAAPPVRWRDLPLTRIAAAELAARYRFVAQPRG